MKKSHLMVIVIVLTGVFYVGSFVALGTGYPTIDSTGQEVLDWFTDNGTNARIYAWAAAFISLGLAIWGGQIAGVLPKPHRYILLGGVLGGAITVQVQAWFWAGMAFHPEGLDPGTARTLFDITSFWGPLFNGSTTAMAAAVMVLGFGANKVVPTWLGWLSVLFFAEQAIETITVFGTNGFLAPGGTMNVYVGGIIGFAWIAGVAFWAARELNARDAAQPTAA